MMGSYVGVVHKDPTSDFGVSFPDFPGCISAGNTIEEAKTLAVEALAGHIRVMAADGDHIPQPSSLEVIKVDPDYADAFAFITVTVDVGSPKAVRVNITIPQDILSRVDAESRKRGFNRSSFLTQAARIVIEKQLL